MSAALTRRYGRAEAAESLSVADVEQLPIGSLVWSNDHRQALVVVPGGLAPTSILTERASEYVPPGEAVATLGSTFALISRGSGKVLAGSTAQRKVMTWWETRRRA